MSLVASMLTLNCEAYKAPILELIEVFELEVAYLGIFSIVSARGSNHDRRGIHFGPYIPDLPV